MNDRPPTGDPTGSDPHTSYTVHTAAYTPSYEQQSLSYDYGTGYDGYGIDYGTGTYDTTTWPGAHQTITTSIPSQPSYASADHGYAAQESTGQWSSRGWNPGVGLGGWDTGVGTESWETGGYPTDAHGTGHFSLDPNQATYVDTSASPTFGDVQIDPLGLHSPHATDPGTTGSIPYAASYDTGQTSSYGFDGYGHGESYTAYGTGYEVHATGSYPIDPSSYGTADSTVYGTDGQGNPGTEPRTDWDSGSYPAAHEQALHSDAATPQNMDHSSPEVPRERPDEGEGDQVAGVTAATSWSAGTSDAPPFSPSRSRRRAAPRAQRSALLTVAVPSACVMGVAVVAAASVSGVGSDQDGKSSQAAQFPAVQPDKVNNKLDTQLSGVSRNADDFADRASRTQERLDLKERQEAERKRREAEAARREALRPKFAVPVEKGGLSAYYGQSGVNWMSLHTGIDFPVSYGTAVMAATDGTVRTQWDPSYGNMVIVTAADGTETWYCHLSGTKIRSGQVKAGDVIAYSGNSGNSTGPHLHFEVRPGGGSAIDPLAWFRSKGLDPT